MEGSPIRIPLDTFVGALKNRNISSDTGCFYELPYLDPCSDNFMCWDVSDADVVGQAKGADSAGRPEEVVKTLQRVKKLEVEGKIATGTTDQLFTKAQAAFHGNNVARFTATYEAALAPDRNGVSLPPDVGDALNAFVTHGGNRVRAGRVLKAAIEKRGEGALAVSQKAYIKRMLRRAVLTVWLEEKPSEIEAGKILGLLGMLDTPFSEVREDFKRVMASECSMCRGIGTAALRGYMRDPEAQRFVKELIKTTRDPRDQRDLQSLLKKK